MDESVEAHAEPRAGRRVVDSNGGEIGRVKGVLASGYMEVERQGEPHWFVPSEVIAGESEDTITLAFTPAQVDRIALKPEPSAGT